MSKFLSIVLAVSIPVCVYASGPGTTGATFLKIGIGARPVSMGEAFAGVADDADAIYWNPAGLAGIEAPQASFTHAAWFETIKYEHLAFSYPSSKGTFSGAINRLSMSPIEKYDKYGTKMNATYEPSDTAMTLSYARKMFGFSSGINLKYIKSEIDGSSAAGILLDVGGMRKLLDEKLSLGLVLQNLGQSIAFDGASDATPLNIKLGSAYKLLDNKLTLALDLNKPRDNDIRANLGAEYLYELKDSLTLAGRAGYKTNTDGLDTMDGLSIGIGARISKKYGMDYAWVPYGDLGDTHRISLSASF
ncbi:PorV/PorQ family protein [Elusimicrobiota bacterium]